MDTKVKIYLERAENEYDIARVMFKISQEQETKLNFELEKDETFYSAVISHSYYSIFYATKALLLTKKIETSSPEVHRKTLEEFKKHFIDTGELDVELLRIYKKMIVRAEELLEIYKTEKRKRGDFTYKTIPQANVEPSKESLENTKIFLKNIKRIIENP
ncbi:MAG: HEPN domain-containing protein [Nanoarchaeota archaeon]|nr:HEPN domain-containing protein [Nanoarchaeota archaeon]